MPAVIKISCKTPFVIPNSFHDGMSVSSSVQLRHVKCIAIESEAHAQSTYALLSQFNESKKLEKFLVYNNPEYDEKNPILLSESVRMVAVCNESILKHSDLSKVVDLTILDAGSRDSKRSLEASKGVERLNIFGKVDVADIPKTVLYLCISGFAYMSIVRAPYRNPPRIIHFPDHIRFLEVRFFLESDFISSEVTVAQVLTSHVIPDVDVVRFRFDGQFPYINMETASFILRNALIYQPHTARVELILENDNIKVNYDRIPYE